MPSAPDRIDIAPPRDAGTIRSLALALLIHAALIAALTWGVNWKRGDRSVSFEAELWSSAPQEAAPKLIEPAPLPSPSPAPSPTPPPKVEPIPKVIAAPEPKVDIPLEQEKKRKLLEQKNARAQAAKTQAEAEALAEKERKLKLELAKIKVQEDAKKLDAKRQAAKELAAKEQASAAASEAQRKANIARSMGLAGASGSEAAIGTAQKSSGPAGPSASYGGRVKAKVKPNIVFTEDIAGNPSAEVEVRTALDGTIMSQRLVKSSGNKAWDDAVVKAIIRTEIMPRDVDGRVPTPMIIAFTPKD